MLPRVLRLNQEKDILNTLRYGKKVSGEYVDLRIRRSKRISSRFGFVVSKKVHNKPVKRNLIKRRMREVVYKNRQLAQQSSDYLFIARPVAQMATFKNLEADILLLFNRAETSFKKVNNSK